MIKRVIVFKIIVLLNLVAFGQNIKTAEDFLGYELGTEFTDHYKVIDYFEHVSENSPNVKIFHYGQTYEKNPLIIAAISSVENINNLEKYRLENLRKTGLETGESNGEQIPIVWLSYNVHGNESVSTEVALGVLSKLVSGDESVKKWLDNLIIIIDPCLNPDGRERYVNWYKQVGNVTPNTNFDSQEHRELWPGGRFNHYLFDLNRDWAWLTQTETVQRIKIYQEWMPHVHVDFHEMGHQQSYFFPPGALPYHNALTGWQNKFQTIMGKEQAKYFDKNNWLYFTSEIFDLFCPNFGDTWPSFNGAMGFTYEQGGSGRAGLAVAVDKDTVTLKVRYDHHYAASLTTLETTLRYKEQLISEFNKYFTESNKSPEGKYKSYIIKKDNDTDKIKALLKYLDCQKIKYAYSKTFAKKLTGFSYQKVKEVPFVLESKDIVISTYQPKSNLVRVMFEPESILTDSLTYDLTAWSLPYVYDMDVYAVKNKLELLVEPVKIEFEKNTTSKDSPYAFLIEWTDIQDARLLSSLLSSEIQVRYANKTFSFDNKSFDRGTLIITKFDNKYFKGDLTKEIVNIANQFEQKLYPVYSGWTDVGIDLGSDQVKLIKKPTIALFSGEPFRSTAFGEIWHFFEQEINYPITVLRQDYSSEVDLSKYDILLLPSGDISELKEKDKIFSFVKNGGKLIAIEEAVGFFARDSSTLIGKAYAKKKKEEKKGESVADDNTKKKYGERRREYLKNTVQGAIYKTDLDDTHPLSYGLGKEWHVLKRNNDVYPLLSGHGWNVGVIRKGAYVSGFSGYKFREKVDDSLILGTENMGEGKLIYITDSPIYRGFWHSGKLLFSNLIFFY